MPINILLQMLNPRIFYAVKYMQIAHVCSIIINISVYPQWHSIKKNKKKNNGIRYK